MILWSYANVSVPKCNRYQEEKNLTNKNTGWDVFREKLNKVINLKFKPRKPDEFLAEEFIERLRTAAGIATPA